MGFLQIESSNPNFSYILEKNPMSGLQFKKHKKGLFSFWFSEEDKKFNIYFKDSSSEISYNEHPNADFEYSSVSKYNNPRMYLDMIQEILNSAREKDSSFDQEGFDNSILLPIIGTQFKSIDIFQRYSQTMGIEIFYEEVSLNNYKVVLKTKKTMRKLINLTALFGLFAALNSEDFIYVGEELVEKYIRIANYLNVPYFIKYLIKIRMVRSENKFKRLKSELEKSSNSKFEFTFGNTHDMRITFIKEHLFGLKPIIDIGTGIDYRYLRFLGPTSLANDQKYYAIDSDEEARIKIQKRIENSNWTNVLVFDSINKAIDEYEFDEKPFVDVLCTEVLEHNSLTEARSLILKVLNEININKFIITVPNVEFNKNYQLDGFRHDDHKWEISYSDFKDFIYSCLNGLSNKYKVEFYQIGDKVDDVSVSSGCIIECKN